MRMRWDDDERLYQPRIHSRRIRELHSLSEASGQPMTVLVDRAISEYVEGRNETVDQETAGAIARAL